MLIREQLQTVIHKMEVGFGVRIIRWLFIFAVLSAMLVLYDTRAYHNFNSPEAMDAAQLARNISEGRGYTTEFIRPFSLYLVQKRYGTTHPAEMFSTNITDMAQVYTAHPDLANAPLYPVMLGGLMKVWTPQWKIEKRKPFWSEGGAFLRYKPEFCIALFNQSLLFGVLVLTFQVGRKLFDETTGWFAAALTLGSDVLWKFSVSGLPTLLLMMILLGLTWCLIKVEENGRAERPDIRRLFCFAVLAGLLTGLGMLTRYSFGWLIVPVAVFLSMFGGIRRLGLAVTAVLGFATIVSPWALRNFFISGAPFGTAGYAVVEGTSGFPGSTFTQSLSPDMLAAFWLRPYGHKLLENVDKILRGDIFHLAGGWLGILFFAGLLAGLGNTGARRLRYFTLMSLLVLIVIQALGQTGLSTILPEFNTENLLVLLTPLVVIFGTGFFFTLVDRMNLPSVLMRPVTMLVLTILTWWTLVSTIILRVPATAYPPYYPPDMQRIAGWMRPDELMMSDIPWAVAWYGDRQCTWTTINSQYEFFQLNDRVKPVHGLYLSVKIVDSKILSECVNGGVGNWSRFAFELLTPQQKNFSDSIGKVNLDRPNTTTYPTDFPLHYAPLDTISSGLYLTDRQRW
ncbi:MAG TPA: glycosyltransferase family 39 protein [Verrucomicrobiae bacterium]|nr:glycosyltransferase family 39 protein [Verrucomicrobiae bacterium]